MPSPRALAPLRHRRFAMLWTAAFVSNIGTWMETVGVGIFVTTSTGKAGWTGLVAAAAFVPTALLAPLGGALADRIPRRRLLLITTAVQVVFASMLAVVATGDPSPVVVTVIVLGAGCAGAIGLPAFQALLPDLVPREDLTGAIALSSAQWNLGRVIGPALAGIVIGVGGYQTAFAINAASFLGVFGVVASLRLPRPAPHGGLSILGSIREGGQFVRRDPALRWVVSCLAWNSLLAAPFIALVPAMALKVFGDEDTGTALLITAQGIGAVTMALSIAALHRRFGISRFLVTMVTVLPLPLVAYALAPTLAFGVTAMYFVGFAYLGVLSSFSTVAQLRAPAELRGRVMSVLMMIIGALYPLGAVLQGAIADEIGMRATTAGAALLLFGGYVLARLLRPQFFHALDDVQTPGRRDPDEEARSGPSLDADLADELLEPGPIGGEPIPPASSFRPGR